VRELGADFPEDDEEPALVLNLMEHVSMHPALRSLWLDFAPLHTRAAMRAVVDVALSSRLAALSLTWCGLAAERSDDCISELARLVSDGTLTELLISNQLHYSSLFNDHVDVSPLCAALRSSTTLTSLTLQDLGIWTHLATGNAILRALTGHASLQKLDLFQRDGDDGGNAELEQRALAQSVAITALVAADAPALQHLNLDGIWFGGDAGRRPIYQALSQNTHLRTLTCVSYAEGAGITEDPTFGFLRRTVLPAVRFCTSLRSLKCNFPHAEQLVQRRADAEAAGALLPAPMARSRSTVLPHAVLLKIVAQLPVDCRLRCMEVCTSWYMLLSGAEALWQRIDLSPGSGICVRPSNRLLMAAAARAVYNPEFVNLTGVNGLMPLDEFIERCSAPLPGEAEQWYLSADYRGEKLRKRAASWMYPPSPTCSSRRGFGTSFWGAAGMQMLDAPSMRGSWLALRKAGWTQQVQAELANPRHLHCLRYRASTPQVRCTAHLLRKSEIAAAAPSVSTPPCRPAAASTPAPPLTAAVAASLECRQRH
jgi:hypothetical protein